MRNKLMSVPAQGYSLAPETSADLKNGGASG